MYRQEGEKAFSTRKLSSVYNQGADPGEEGGPPSSSLSNKSLQALKLVAWKGLIFQALLLFVLQKQHSPVSLLEHLFLPPPCLVISSKTYFTGYLG